MKLKQKYLTMKYMFGIGLLAVFFWLGCSSATKDQNSDQVILTKTDTVEIKAMAFNPAEITVNKGDTILFINNDIVNHDVTEINKAWTSGTLQPGDSWSKVFTESADYFCSLHLVMKGKVLVK